MKTRLKHMLKHYYYGASGRDRNDCGRQYAVTVLGAIVGTLFLPVALPIMLLYLVGDTEVWRPK